MTRQRTDLNFDEVLRLVRLLSPLEKLRLIARIAPEIEAGLLTDHQQPGVSLLGLLRDLGPAPSAEDIDEARREAWSNFPRDID